VVFMKRIPIIHILIFALAGLTLVNVGSYTPANAAQTSQGQGLAAIDNAAKANKYLFILFYREDDQQTQSMKQTFDLSLKAMADRAYPLTVLVTNPSEDELVKKFGVSQAPMPLIVVIAPNGAVTASYIGKVTEEQLMGSFASPCMEKTAKALQEGKLILLCIQNGKTKFNAEAMDGVNAFKADQRYSQATEILMLDPSASSEKSFLVKLGMNAPIEEAATIFMAPPGSIIGSFKGGTNQEQLISTLTSAISSCAGGCQPGQCCTPAK
jgi:hypothetical protein